MLRVIVLLLALQADFARATCSPRQAETRAACECRPHWIWRDGECVRTTYTCEDFLNVYTCPQWCVFFRGRGCLDAPPAPTSLPSSLPTGQPSSSPTLSTPPAPTGVPVTASPAEYERPGPGS